MANSDANKVPLLVTMDLEVAYDHNISEQEYILEKIVRDLDLIHTPITVFTTVDAAIKFSRQLRLLKSSGHEIGYHGISHRIDENFTKMSQAEIQTNISEGSKNVQAIVHEHPRCFRGPFMTTSALTHKVLIENGYVADFSVCPQRLDIFNSKGGNLGWLYAPRKPYFPSEYSPYRKGSLPIRIVPLSCIGAPFLSGMLYLFGLVFMKFFFKILLCEAKKNKKPIVYCFHSYEFTAFTGSQTGRSPVQKLYRQDRAERYRQHYTFLKYIRAFDSIKPITATEYLKDLQSPLI
jgi:hypothetical protein